MGELRKLALKSSVGLNSPWNPVEKVCPRWYVSSVSFLFCLSSFEGSFLHCRNVLYIIIARATVFGVKTSRPVCSCQELLQLILCHMGGVFVFCFSIFFSFYFNVGGLENNERLEEVFLKFSNCKTKKL